VQEGINRGRHSDHPAGCHSIRTNQCPPAPYFYGPDALCAAQPTVSNHLITAHMYKKNTFEKICSGQMILKVTQDLWKWHCLTGRMSLPISGLLVSRNSTIYSRNDLQGLKVINDGAIL